MVITYTRMDMRILIFWGGSFPPPPPPVDETLVCFSASLLLSPVTVCSPTSGEDGLWMSMSRSSRKQTKMERFNFFSSLFLSTRRGRSTLTDMQYSPTQPQVKSLLTTVVWIKLLQPLLPKRSHHRIIGLSVQGALVTLHCIH